MIAEKSEGALTPRRITERIQAPWIRLVFSVLLSACGLWFVTRDISFADIRLVLRQADLRFILLGFLVIVLTMAAKAWRWQHLFHPRSEAPSFPNVFWALTLGQLVNTAVPFLRLGEVARVLHLGKQANSSKAQALGTLVVEKILDLIMLTVTLFLLLPFLVIPDFVSESGLALAAIAFVAFLMLYLVAFKSELVLRVARLFLRPLPWKLEGRISSIIATGLHGLSALRSARTTFSLLLSSALIALLSVTTPWVLFPALDIPLGLVAASSIHVVLTIGTLPPSTPAKVGVFEFLVAFMLHFFDVENNALILTYTIIYHLVVVLPQIMFGGIAAARGKRDG